jgi:PadR family transcriptional regulator, regulatory protein AphA
MPATQSQLYGELAHLAATGLVQASHPGPRGRKELTPLATHTDLERGPRNPTLLRVFLWTLPPQAARAYREQVATRSRAFHQRLRDLQASLDNHAGVAAAEQEHSGFERCGRLVLEHGLRLSAARAD